jgi:hypothetical protein
MNLRKHKPTIQIFAAIALIALGCGLLVAGFILPPPGEIHNSVLIAFGEILTFAGALFGIDYKYARPKDRDEDITP